MNDEKLVKRIAELEQYRDKLMREANLELANVSGRIDELQKLLAPTGAPVQEDASGAG